MVKLWNKYVTLIKKIVGELGMVFKDIEKTLEELEISVKIETIQTTALW